MHLLLIRHGESEADILKVHEGRADFPLTTRGRRQVELMAEKIKSDFPPEFIWASTLKRASETASHLAESIGCSVVYEEALMEYNNGVQAGLLSRKPKNFQFRSIYMIAMKKVNHI